MKTVEELAKEAGFRPIVWDGNGTIVYDAGPLHVSRFRDLVLEEAANGASALAKKWWTRHCETNRHMETTREAHEDFCQLERAIRAMKGQK